MRALIVAAVMTAFNLASTDLVVHRTHSPLLILGWIAIVVALSGAAMALAMTVGERGR